jgi:hypothetical protein
MRTSTFAAELEQGHVTRLQDSASDRDLLPPGRQAPLLTVRVAGVDHVPARMRWLRPQTRLALYYDAVGVSAEIAVAADTRHLTLELVALEPAPAVELIIWGPYPTVLRDVVGETVGVVQGGGLAMGIQALNPRTLGGVPVGDSDIAPTQQAFAADDELRDIPEGERQRQLLRGNTAERTPWGSRLAAYCRDRTCARTIANWTMERHQVAPLDDGGVVGSRIAIFVAPASQALETIGGIEQSEGLPHPLLGTEWAKTSPAASASYLIVDFSEGTLDAAVDMAQRAGLDHLYHSGPFHTWGHFELDREAFPHGWDGFRDCVRSAAAAGMKLGFHTLSNFITTSDAYVTPVPDERLAHSGTSALVAVLDPQQTSIGVEDPAFFTPQSTLNTVMIGRELVRYEGVSPDPPWTLTGCTRGAWGTAAGSHPQGAPVKRLQDHPYSVFLTDAQLSQEVAQRIAAFCNHTGAMQLSFDGLEGNFSTGLGEYGTARFTAAWYDHLSPELRGRVINDASMPGHYSWHTYTRMNWGEPWYAGFRESQTRYRLQNQDYFRRNLMPRMLGWFALRADTTLEDAEWLLARAAGFDAGFALATSIDFSGDQIRLDQVLPGGATGELEEILAAVQGWETARMAGAFQDHLKPALQDIDSEFHLEPCGAGAWALYPVYSLKQRLHSSAERLEIDNPYGAQPLALTVRNAGESAIADLQLGLSTAAASPAESGSSAPQHSDSPAPPSAETRSRPPAEPVPLSGASLAMSSEGSADMEALLPMAELLPAGATLRLDTQGRRSIRAASGELIDAAPATEQVVNIQAGAATARLLWRAAESTAEEGTAAGSTAESESRSTAESTADLAVEFRTQGAPWPIGEHQV